MSVSLYDLLDVEETASADEIRAAWKSAIADLEPADRRFRAFNDAAGVLLDPEKRADYDAELAAERGDAEADETDVETVEADVETDEPLAVATEADEPDAPDADAPDVIESTPSAGPPTWSLLVAAGVAVLAAALAIVVLTWPGSLGGTSPAEREDRVAAAEESAPNAAETAVPVLLSFDYRTFDANVEEANRYLTESFAADRADLLDDLETEVNREKVVVTTVVSGTGFTRVTEDGDLATVVVFLEQDSKHGKDPSQLLRMWATLRMVADGDDWLVDDICIQDDDCS